MTAKRIALFMVCLASVASIGVCWDGEEAAEKLNTAASDALQDAKHSAGSWAEWAATKLTGGVSGGSDKARELVEKTEEAAAKSTDTMNAAASDTSKLASEKVNDWGETTSGGLHAAKTYASDKAGEVSSKLSSEKASDKANIVKDKSYEAASRASSIADGARNAVKDGIAGETIKMATDKAKDGKDKAYSSYEDASAKVQETYASAKDSMSEEAKQKYELAKERASEATGDLGARMTSGPAEL